MDATDLVPYPPSPGGGNYLEVMCGDEQIGLTAYLVAKSNAIFLAGSFGRFNASGLPGIRSSRYKQFEKLTSELVDSSEGQLRCW